MTPGRYCYLIVLAIFITHATRADVNVANSALSRGDFAIAANEFKRLAEAGDPRAQAHLGYLYYVGEGVEQNYAEAVKWYQKAAAQGDADAQYNLAVAHAFGEGLEQDYKEAARWYRRAAEQGHAIAQYSLGISYAYGEGVEQDAKEAAGWFQKSAEQGYVRAQVLLASLYHTGDGLEQDYDEAAKWYRIAADSGNATAQFNLGAMYRSGKGVTQDYNQAMRWYRLAADQGYAMAQNELAVLERSSVGAVARKTATEKTTKAPATPSAQTAHKDTEETQAPLSGVDNSELPSPEKKINTISIDPAGETATATTQESPAGERAANGTEDKKKRGGIRGFFSGLFKGKGKETEPLSDTHETPDVAKAENAETLKEEGAVGPSVEQAAISEADGEMLTDVMDATEKAPDADFTDTASEVAILPQEDGGDDNASPAWARTEHDVIYAKDDEKEKSPGPVRGFFSKLFSKDKEAEVADREATGDGIGEEPILAAENARSREDPASTEIQTKEMMAEEAADGVDESDAQKTEDKRSGAHHLHDRKAKQVAIEATPESIEEAIEEADNTSVARADQPPSIVEEREPGSDHYEAMETELIDKALLLEETAEEADEEPEKKQGFFARLFGARDKKEAEGNITTSASATAKKEKTIVAGDERTQEGQFYADPEEIEAGMQALESLDYSAAYNMFRSLAVQGDALAQYQLGALYHQGLGATPDLAEASRWYGRAAERGDANAQYSLGNMYLMGEGVGQDDAKAAYWYEKAANQGHAAAKDNLASLQRISKVKAEQELKKEAMAAELEQRQQELSDEKVASASTEKRRGFSKGLFGADEDPKDSVADQAPVDIEDEAPRSDPPATSEDTKGGFFSRLFGGTKESQAPTDEVRSSSASMEGADVEDAKPATETATDKTRLAGVHDPRQSKTKRSDVVFDPLERSGAISNYELGMAYSLGDGVEQNHLKAFEHFSQSAEQGYAAAQYKLGIAYAYGEGVDKDASKAARWYTKAAEQGHVIAQRNLGVLYLNGDGVEQNKPLALAWYSLLAESGNRMDTHRRDALSATLSPAEIDEAERLKNQLQGQLAPL